MFVVIAIAEAGESHIRRYETDNARDARNRFVQDWIDEKVQWEWWEYYGPNCTVDNPAFTPDFLRQEGFHNEPAPEEIEGVTIYTWWCITGNHGSDEHFVTGYFIPSKGLDR